MLREIDDLEREAARIIEDLGLEKVLAKYGEAHLVGNLALHTTVRPDIDFLVYAPRSTWPSAAKKLAGEIVELGHNNYRIIELRESGKYLLSFKLIVEGISWDLHISFSERTGDYLTDSYQFYLDYGDKFTPQNIDTIKGLKRHFLENKMLGMSMSYFIYRAVIDQGAETVDDIYKFLENNNIDISRFKR